MIRISYNTDLRKLTTFGLPAECGRLIEFDSTSDLTELHASGELKAPLLPLGGGSNLLFTTGRFDGTVLHCTSRDTEFSQPDENGNVALKAAAGAVLDDLCASSCTMGLWGLENLSGIPGEAGGAAVQNVGAYGSEFADIVVAVECFDCATGRTTIIPADKCLYGYRDSIFKHTDSKLPLIVTSVTLHLSTRPAPRLGYAALATRFSGCDPASLTPQMLRDAVTVLRDAKLPSPSHIGSAGSFFKNPVISMSEFDTLKNSVNNPIPAHVLSDGNVKLSAAWLIDNAGCKTLRCGDATVWQQQPLVIVNATGNATGSDVIRLEQAINEAVFSRFGIELVPEVIHV